MGPTNCCTSFKDMEDTLVTWAYTIKREAHIAQVTEYLPSSPGVSRESVSSSLSLL